MKAFKYFIIFTTIIILIFSLSISAAAATTELTPDRVSMSSSAGISYQYISIFTYYSDALAAATYDNYTLALPPDNINYDNYIVVNGIEVTQSYYPAKLIVYYDPLDLGSAFINEIKFRYSTIFDRSQSAPVLDILQNGSVIDNSLYSIKYTRNDVVHAGAVDVYYSDFFVDVFFNEGIDLSKGLEVRIEIDCISLGSKSSQIIGLDNFDISYTTANQFIKDIGDDVKLLTDMTAENNVVLNEIFNTIVSGDEDSQAAIEKLNGTIADIDGSNSYNTEAIQSLYNAYLDYQLSEPLSYFEVWQSTLNDVLINNPFISSTWFWLFDANGFIGTILVIVVSFAVAKFVIFDLR